MATFRSLLSAMYNRPYHLGVVQDVIKLVDMADFCCALEIVSATLSAQLLNSDIITERYNEEYGEKYSLIFSYCLSSPALLLAARKLRHAILFRECLVYIVARWGTSKLGNELRGDEPLLHLIEKHYGILMKKIAVANTC